MIRMLITLFLLLFSTHEEENKVAKPHEYINKSVVADNPRVQKVSAPLAVEAVSKEIYDTFEITAFTSGVESTGKSPSDPEYGITASGKHVKENHTAACPKSMEFGTRLYIPYFDETFVCEDRGSAITEGHIDIYMKSLNKAQDFGRRDLKVKVMEESN